MGVSTSSTAKQLLRSLSLCVVLYCSWCPILLFLLVLLLYLYLSVYGAVFLRKCNGILKYGFQKSQTLAVRVDAEFPLQIPPRQKQIPCQTPPRTRCDQQLSKKDGPEIKWDQHSLRKNGPAIGGKGETRLIASWDKNIIWGMTRVQEHKMSRSDQICWFSPSEGSTGWTKWRK